MGLGTTGAQSTAVMAVSEGGCAKGPKLTKCIPFLSLASTS